MIFYFQNGGRLPSWFFKGRIFFRPIGFKRPMCISIPNFIEINQTVLRYRDFFRFSRWLLSGGIFGPRAKSTHSHLSWLSTILNQLPPSTTIHSILQVQFTCLTVFLLYICRPNSNSMYFYRATYMLARYMPSSCVRLYGVDVAYQRLNDWTCLHWALHI